MFCDLAVFRVGTPEYMLWLADEAPNVIYLGQRSPKCAILRGELVCKLRSSALSIRIQDSTHHLVGLMFEFRHFYFTCWLRSLDSDRMLFTNAPSSCLCSLLKDR